MQQYAMEEELMKHVPRKHQRVYLTFYLRVFEGEDFIGYLIDISKEGIMIMSDYSLQVGKYYLLNMKLPASSERKGEEGIQSIEFTAECKRSEHDSVDREFYLNGFEITDIDDDTNAVIHKIIEEYRIP